MTFSQTVQAESKADREPQNTPELHPTKSGGIMEGSAEVVSSLEKTIERTNRHPVHVLIPAYNEETAIGGVVSEVYGELKEFFGPGNFRITVIDDGSSDETYRILKGLEKKIKVVNAFSNGNNM